MAAVPNFGTTLKIGTASPPTTTLTNVVEINPPNPKRDAVDATNHGSSGGAQEFIPDGVYDPGQLTFTLNYIGGDANDTALLAALAATSPYYFQWTVNAASGVKTFTSQGIVTSYGPDAKPVKGKQQASCSVQLSGPVTIA